MTIKTVDNSQFNKKELWQYTTASLTLLTGIVMCFLSFFLNNYDITGSVLGYFGETLVFAAGVFGVNIYFNNKMGKMASVIEENIERKLKEHQCDYH